MIEVFIMGELLVEIMRKNVNDTLYEAGEFLGPYPSGAPGIFIDTIARLGHKCAISSGVGDDDFGKCILDRLKEDGVNCDNVILSKEKSTGVAFVTYFEDGRRKFIFHLGNTPAVEAKMPNVNNYPNVKYMHIMGCSIMANISFAKEIVKTMQAFIDNGTKISFDPNIRIELFNDNRIKPLLDEVYHNMSVFMPGKDELLMFSGCDSVEDAVNECFEKTKCEIIALKNGSKGSIIYTKQRKIEIGAYVVEQVDPTGAGDCFDAAFLSGLIHNKPLEYCGKMAAAAGAINATAFGPMEGKIDFKKIENVILNNNMRCN